MKMAWVVIIFFLAAVFELTVAPKVLGGFLPFSYWAFAALGVWLGAAELFWFSAISGILFGALHPEFGGYALVLFFAAAGGMLAVRHRAAYEGVARDAIEAACGIVLLQFSPFVFSAFPSASEFFLGAFSWWRAGETAFLSGVFLAVFTLFLIAREGKRASRRAAYV